MHEWENSQYLTELVLFIVHQVDEKSVCRIIVEA